MDWFPIHSWHPMVIHVPLVAFLLAAGLDLLGIVRPNPEWRRAGTLLWWVGLIGAGAAVATGLIAYNRVDHSDHAHEAMILHRNVAFVVLGVLVAAGLVRWRIPRLRLHVVLGTLGAIALGGVGYLGGELVYTHGLGISDRNLDRIMDERGGHAHREPMEMPAPADRGPVSPDTAAVPPSSDAHEHSSGTPRVIDPRPNKPVTERARLSFERVSPGAMVAAATGVMILARQVGG